jgi:Alpha/beta hydrolase
VTVGAVAPGDVPDADLPPWAVQDLAPVSTAAVALLDVADTLRRVAARLTGLLGVAAAALGWSGTASDAAGASAEASGRQLVVAADALGDAGSALRTFVAVAGPAADVLTHWARARPYARAYCQSLPNDLGPGVYQAFVDGNTADRAAAGRVRQAAGALARTADVRAEDAWVGPLAPAGALGPLAGAGVVADLPQQRVLGEAAGLRAGAEGAARLRSLLEPLTPAAAAAFLERHPDLARLLVAGLPAASAVAPGSPDARLRAAIDRAARLDGVARARAVGSALAAMGREDVRRLAALYPFLVDNLDGAPPDARITANRIAMAVALSDERIRHTGLVLGADDEPDLAHAWARIEGSGPVGLLVRVDTLDRRLTDSGARVDLLRSLLGNEVHAPTAADPSEGRPRWLPHQVLAFDTDDGGRIAELWGVLDERTRHVAVFVPGTGSTLAGFDDPSTTARRLAADAGPSTATIAWLGSPLPTAVVANAADPSYAEVAGPRLRDFVAGLRLPAGADSTVVGHSYGGAVVGVADREGMPATRVLHVESAGAGRRVWSVADYHEAVPVQHYTMTAPGDPIAGARVSRDLQDAIGLGHGGDPDRIPGFVRLETGRFDDVADPARRGRIIRGVSAHTQVLTPGSTAWRNVVAVVTGGVVVPVRAVGS